MEEIIGRLSANDTVTQIYRMTGSSSLHVHAVASSQEALETFIRTELDRLPGVIRLNSHVILSRIKDVKGLRL